MKKILFYTMTLDYGGAEKNICALANYFSKHYQVVLVSNIKSNIAFPLDKSIKVYQLDKNETGIKKIFAKFSLRRSKQLEEIVKSEKINLIVSFLPEPSIRALGIKKKLNIPVVVGVRNHPKYEYPYTKIVRNHYYRYADKIIFQHKGFINYLPAYLRNNCEIIPNSLENVNSINTVKKDVIINVGRLEKPKNQVLLIKAFSLLSAAYKNYELHIYGEGKMYSKLNKLIKKLNLEERIFIYPNCQDVKKHIASAKLFVLPSKFEGMPNVVLEALLLKTKVVSTNSTPVIEDLIDKKYISDFNSKDLAKKMELALNNKYNFNLKINNDEIYKTWESVINNLL